jgi:serine/threonine-protein kinase RsbW
LEWDPEREIMPHTREGPAGHIPVRQCAEVRTTAEINSFIGRLLGEMARAGFGEHDQFGVRLALEEAIINGIKHGNREDPTKFVRIYYAVSPREIVTEVEDQGPGFNPSQVPSPLAPENLERPGGRGVFLMRHYMTMVQYNERGNRVLLCKTRAATGMHANQEDKHEARL